MPVILGPILGTINPEVHIFTSKEDSKVFPSKFKSSFGTSIVLRIHAYQGAEIQQLNYVEFVVMQRQIAHIPLDILQHLSIPCRGFTNDPCVERHTHFVPTVFVSYDNEFIQLEALFGERVPFVRVYANGPDRKAIGRIQTYYDLVAKVDKYFSVHHILPTIKNKKKVTGQQLKQFLNPLPPMDVSNSSRDPLELVIPNYLPLISNFEMRIEDGEDH